MKNLLPAAAYSLPSRNGVICGRRSPEKAYIGARCRRISKTGLVMIIWGARCRRRPKISSRRCRRNLSKTKWHFVDIICAAVYFSL